MNLAFEIRRSSNDDRDFVNLVKLLDADLAIRDGDDHEFYHQFNGIESLDGVLTCYSNSKAIGCGAIKKFDAQSAEVKRMYTLPEWRGKGIAGLVLQELESLAKGMGYKRCILETGKMQPEAIGLYKKHGYKVIPNYGQYTGVANSVCFEKFLP